MSLRKVAMLALMLTVVTGFGMKPVSAVASEAVSEETASTGSDDTAVTEEIVLDAEDGDAEVADEDAETVDEDNETADEDTEDSEDKEKAGNSGKKSKASKSKAKKSNYTKAELRLMASIINCEAGAESYQGKLAVGIVIMNRIKSKDFPDTLKKVIYQPGQFSPVRNGSLNKRLSQYDAGKINSRQWKHCISAAKKVLNGQRTILYKGKTKNLEGYYFFSVELSGARLRLGGHKFK